MNYKKEMALGTSRPTFRYEISRRDLLIMVLHQVTEELEVIHHRGV